MTKRRRSTGQAIGSILAGLDHQVFRATKPPAELVESARPAPTVAGRDGSLLSIDVPLERDDAAGAVDRPKPDRPSPVRPEPAA